tara:strand:- start:292 stop:579 length:288 start_codon:yes stop_codon:yes gene_type:complete
MLELKQIEKEMQLMLELKQIAKEMQIGDSVFFKESYYIRGKPTRTRKNSRFVEESSILIKFLKAIGKESLRQGLYENENDISPQNFKGRRVWCIK